jgi:hypothetical protein
LSEGGYSLYLSDDDKAKIVIGIVDRVTCRFDELARELVASVSSSFIHDSRYWNLVESKACDLDF